MSHLPLEVRKIIIIIISVSFQNFTSSENCLGPYLCLFHLHVMFPQLSCLLINYQKGPCALKKMKSKVVHSLSEWFSEWVTRSPMDLSWKAKKTWKSLTPARHPFCDCLLVHLAIPINLVCRSCVEETIIEKNISLSNAEPSFMDYDFFLSLTSNQT